jgi:hypothetical protein
MAVYVLPCDFPIPYGCWCGITDPFPAEGDPIDNYDQHCKNHDYCYVEGIEQLGCTVLDEYVWLYDWDKVDGKVGPCKMICLKKPKKTLRN